MGVSRWSGSSETMGEVIPSAGLLLALLAAPSASPGPATALAEIEAAQVALFRGSAPSVVFVHTHQGFGSGFYVSRKGHIVTNRHVVGNRRDVKIVTFAGRRLVGRVLAHATDGTDLALIKVPLKNTPSLGFTSTSRIEIGQFLAALGHGRGGVWTFNTGMLSNLHGPRGQRVLQTQIPVNPGASGGPVLDRHGRVVGIVTSGVDGANSINFAIPSDTIVRAFPQIAEHCNCIRVSAPPKRPVFVDGQLVGQGPSVVFIATPGNHKVETRGGTTDKRRSVSFPEVRSVDLK